ncbi:hypothetical protein [Actinoplanes sp. NPDC020271]|uniref:hypothetical protein n=1 Tax=Actinoplanes sp. NPDC020271 TaxID=3363896 RepID=UPI00379E81FE
MRLRTVLASLAAVVMGGALLAPPAASAAATTATIEDSAQGTGVGQVEFSSGWSKCTTNCGLASDNSFRWTSTAGSKLTIRYTGQQITLYGVKEPWATIATAQIDGNAATDVDFYAATSSDETVEVFRSATLPQGTHTLVLTMTDRRNPASAGGSSITFDSAVVTGDDTPVVPAETVVEDTATGTTDGKAEFSSGWSKCTTNCALASDNSFRWTSTAGASVKVRFTGTQITVFGLKEPWSNIATAKIDSNAATDVDYYAATATTETVDVYTSPVLTQGSHTLTLTMTDRRNPASGGGSSITFDSALVVGNGGATEPPAGRDHRSGLPWSDGGWFSHNGSQAKAFGDWRGAPVDNIEAFTDRANWDKQLNSWWGDLSLTGSGFQKATDDFILAVPLWTDDGDEGTDDQWTTLARKIASFDPDGYVRLGWEMNCCFSYARDRDEWRRQYSRAVDLIRAAAPGLKIVFNPNEGVSNNDTIADPRTLFVDGKADVIAIDAYDWWEPYTSDYNVRGVDGDGDGVGHFNKAYGWDFWYDFAQSKGLPFALAEYGVISANVASNHSGADNPTYLTYVYNWLSAKNTAKPGSIEFVSYFNDTDAKGWKSSVYPTTTNPKAAARYKAIITSLKN